MRCMGLIQIQTETNYKKTSLRQLDDKELLNFVRYDNGIVVMF